MLSGGVPIEVQPWLMGGNLTVLTKPGGSGPLVLQGCVCYCCGGSSGLFAACPIWGWCEWSL
eukprot:1498977-Amphidinium_carterae.1